MPSGHRGGPRHGAVRQGCQRLSLEPTVAALPGVPGGGPRRAQLEAVALAPLPLIAPSPVARPPAEGDTQPDTDPRAEHSRPYIRRADQEDEGNPQHAHPDRRAVDAPVLVHGDNLNPQRTPALRSACTRFCIDVTARNATLRWVRMSELSSAGLT